MRKKSGFTILEQAIIRVPEFENVVYKLDQQVELRGQSKSTLNNYIRRIALFVVHFGKLPEQTTPKKSMNTLSPSPVIRGLHREVALSIWFTDFVITTDYLG